MSKALQIERIEKAQIEIETKKASAQNGKMRQRYHFMAEEGWINDPNGLIFFRGKYHYFYQFNPYDSYWGSMYWGHAVSDDMLHWEYLPIALAPSEDYDDHVKGGCFSGSAIEHNGKLYLFYTGTSNHGEGFVQVQCMAYSTDGIHFEKYAGNPVIKVPDGVDSANFRDPKVWEHDGIFYMVCGAKKDNLAKAMLFRSEDLEHWEFFNIMIESRGEFGYMFECPDFFHIGDKDIFMFSPMGVGERTKIYLTGELDYNTGRFCYTTIGEIDWGHDFYAPQSFQDGRGRRLIVGWANCWDWMPWWRDWGPTFKEGWCGAFSLPREVKLLSDGTLQFVPVEELEKIRTEEKVFGELNVGAEPVEFSSGDGIAFESRMVLDLEKTTASQVMLKLRCGDGKESILCYDLQKGEMTFDRSHGDGWSQGISRSSMNLLRKKEWDIHIFSDQSSIEVFSDNYQNNHSNNLFASSKQNKNYILAEGGVAVLKELTSWGLRKTIR